MRTSLRTPAGWVAWASIAAVSAIAASCVLPRYEVAESSGSEASASASSASAATGGGSGGASASSGGMGGAGGQNVGGEGGAGGAGGAGGDPNTACVPDAIAGKPCPTPGEPCEEIGQNSCKFSAICDKDVWVVIDWGSYCPPHDLNVLQGKSCACNPDGYCEVAEKCGNAAGKEGQTAVCTNNNVWEVTSGPDICCGETDVCYPGKEVCVHTVEGMMESAKCQQNPCSLQPTFSCLTCGLQLCPVGCMCAADGFPEGHAGCICP